ncbi:hypothetical protein EC991_000451 [Linnemannia zychae]|nr:hypothetical protein EC991_000451 [Linnemannia zychae]
MTVGARTSRRCSTTVDAIKAEAESSTFRILFDYSVEDNKAEKICQWIQSLWLSLDGGPGGIDYGEDGADYPRVFSAMVHLRAQSVACEEIEAQYYGFGESGSAGLRGALKDFRRTCVITETGEKVEKDKKEQEDKEDSDNKEVGVKEGEGEAEAQEGIVVPGGGLCLEYYSANATALQEHHLNALDDHWQVLLKNRLSGVRNSVGGGAGGGTSTQVDASSSSLSKAAPAIKNYTEFLLAVDRVRRGYLESCIPSPEALSVLDTLDEMQQSESILFLQTLAAAPPLADTQQAAPHGTTSATGTGTQPEQQQAQQQQQQQQTASGKGLPSKRYSITNHPTVALNGRELMIHPAVGDDSRITASGSGNSGSSLSRLPTSAEAPTELEQQIADILALKRQRQILKEASGVKARFVLLSFSSKLLWFMDQIQDYAVCMDLGLAVFPSRIISAECCTITLATM